ncbi:MAG: GNAT family N-acetyltransferase [Leucobacter sp.]|jgi:ribosomal protein S18 acetylase RimI-like enzyme|nr:GNAT family N-acetyltransferase [Leucobacter sp.]
MTELTIRLARPEEYDEVDRLILDSYSHDYGPRDASGDPMRTAAARAERFDVWVARDAAGELLGSVTTSRRGGPSMHEDVAAHELDLRLLGVSPRARRQGIAAALMQHVAEHAAEVGFSAVFLKTAPNMTGAHRLYERLGYERVPERDGLFIGGKKQFDLFTYVLPVGVPASR